MKEFIKKQSTFLLYGFVFWLPVILVIYVVILLFGNGEKVGKMILGMAVPDKYLFVGFGFIFCILIIYLSGMLLKLTKVGKVLSKIPVIGLFFGQGEIMTIGRLTHMQACLFLIFTDLYFFRLDTRGGKGSNRGRNSRFPFNLRLFSQCADTCYRIGSYSQEKRRDEAG